jgi:hypothetical protein
MEGTMGTSLGSEVPARSKYFLANSRSLLHPIAPPSAWAVEVGGGMDERAEQVDERRIAAAPSR